MWGISSLLSALSRNLAWKPVVAEKWGEEEAWRLVGIFSVQSLALDNRGHKEGVRKTIRLRDPGISNRTSPRQGRTVGPSPQSQPSGADKGFCAEACECGDDLTELGHLRPIPEDLCSILEVWSTILEICVRNTEVGGKRTRVGRTISREVGRISRVMGRDGRVSDSNLLDVGRLGGIS